MQENTFFFQKLWFLGLLQGFLKETSGVKDYSILMGKMKKTISLHDYQVDQVFLAFLLIILLFKWDDLSILFSHYFIYSHPTQTTVCSLCRIGVTDCNFSENIKEGALSIIDEAICRAELCRIQSIALLPASHYPWCLKKTEKNFEQ